MKSSKIHFYVLMGLAIFCVASIAFLGGYLIGVRENVTIYSKPELPEAPPLSQLDQIEADPQASKPDPRVEETTVTPVPTNPIAYYPTPRVLAYAKPFGSSGTGPFTVDPQDSLFHFRPDNITEQIEFVPGLTLHITTREEDNRLPPLTFSMWSVLDGGWGINQGFNEIMWGEDNIKINFPDSYVSREGDLYFAIKSHSDEAVVVENITVTLVARHANGREITYAPLH